MEAFLILQLTTSYHHQSCLFPFYLLSLRSITNRILILKINDEGDYFMIKVGLIGFGRAGKMVTEEILKDNSLTLLWVLKKSKESSIYASDLLGYGHKEGMFYSTEQIELEHFFKDHRPDVIIDFSSASSIHKYQHAAKQGINIVSAISNYEDSHYLEIKRWSKQTAILHSPNITLGINFLMSVTKLLQEIMPQADIEIVEEHFRDKKDVSGTALRIAKNLDLDVNKHVNSIRAGGIVGKHEVIFGLPNQTIRIVHESISRAAFAEGAIFAAKWLMNKNTGFYSMEDALATNSKKEQTAFLQYDYGTS